MRQEIEEVYSLLKCVETDKTGTKSVNSQLKLFVPTSTCWARPGHVSDLTEKIKKFFPPTTEVLVPTSLGPRLSPPSRHHTENFCHIVHSISLIPSYIAWERPPTIKVVTKQEPGSEATWSSQTVRFPTQQNIMRKQRNWYTSTSKSQSSGRRKEQRCQVSDHKCSWFSWSSIQFWSLASIRAINSNVASRRQLSYRPHIKCTPLYSMLFWNQVGQYLILILNVADAITVCNYSVI